MAADKKPNVMECFLGLLLYLRFFFSLMAALNRPHYEAIVSAQKI